MVCFFLSCFYLSCVQLGESRTERSVLVSLDVNGIHVADTNLEVRISGPEKLWRKNAWEYQHRYCGHCNATTDIKEANFFGKYVFRASFERVRRGENSFNDLIRFTAMDVTSWPAPTTAPYFSGIARLRIIRAF